MLISKSSENWNKYKIVWFKKFFLVFLNVTFEYYLSTIYLI